MVKCKRLTSSISSNALLSAYVALKRGRPLFPTTGKRGRLYRRQNSGSQLRTPLQTLAGSICLSGFNVRARSRRTSVDSG